MSHAVLDWPAQRGAGMSKNCLRLAGALVLILTTTACPSGSRGYPTGKVCDPGYRPLPVDLDSKPKAKPTDPQKVNFAAAELKNFPGKYTYVSAQMLYVNSETGVKVHISNGFSKETKAFADSINCVSGFKPNTPKFRAMVDVLAGMKVDVNGDVTDLESRHIDLEFDNLLINPKPKFTPGNTQGKTHPLDIYAIDPAVDTVFFYRLNPTTDPKALNFQARAEIKYSKTETLYLSTALKREPPK
jgi:hypothetical protein